MSTLTGSPPYLTYKDLLKVSNNNSGITTSLTTVTDGEDTASPLQLAVSAMNIDRSGGRVLLLDGVTLTAGASALNNASFGESAAFIVISTTGSLTNERALAGRASEVSIVDSGPGGSITISLADAIILTGKTLTGGTHIQPTISVDDNKFTLQDGADSTKRVRLDAGTVATGTLVCLTVPNSSGIIALTGDIANFAVSNAELTALIALSATAGFHVQSGTNIVVGRTITAGAGISITNGSGVGGNPVIAINSLIPVSLGGTGVSTSGAAGDAFLGFSGAGVAFVQRTGAATYALVSLVPVSLGGTGASVAAVAADTLHGFSGTQHAFPIRTSAGAWAQVSIVPVSLGGTGASVGATGLDNLTGIVGGQVFVVRTSTNTYIGVSLVPTSAGGTGVSINAANQVFAGPASGAAAAPTFRTLVPLDMPSGTIIQTLTTTTFAYVTLSVAIPKDDTVPTNSEGTLVLGLSIIPKYSNSRLQFSIVGNMGASSLTTGIFTLFIDSSVAANAAAAADLAGNTLVASIPLFYSVSSNGTVVQQWSLRAGNDSTNAWLNGNSTRFFGGVLGTSMRIEEVSP